MKNDGKKVRAVFYFFTKHDKIPDRFVTIEAWQHVYDNFRCLRSNTKHRNTPKRVLHDVSNTESEESSNETEQPKLKRKVNILDIIGYYFTQSRPLFRPLEHEKSPFTLPVPPPNKDLTILFEKMLDGSSFNASFL